MKTNRKHSEKRQTLLEPLLVIAATAAALYLIFSFIIMPVYTRHWQRVEVPDVTNLSGRAAEKLLRRQKLEPVFSEIKFDERMPNGFVVFQNPGGNSVVKKKRHVYLTLSKGKRPILMPKLIGLAERDARFLLAQNQLVLGSVEHTFDSYYPAGVVADQSIAPQTEVIAGATINMTVSTGAVGGTVIVPNVVGMTFEEASRYIVESGMSVGSVRYSETPAEQQDLVVSQTPEPGLHAGAGDSIELMLSITGGESGVEESASVDESNIEDAYE